MRTCSAALQNLMFLQLHSLSSLATDSEKLGIETMSLEHWDIDSAVNRDRITEWVREKKPAFIIGNPQCRMNEHIQWCCDLYKLQAQGGSLFVHEQPANVAAWKLECLKEVEGWCDSDFDPRYGNRLLLPVAHARVSRVSVWG